MSTNADTSKGSLSRRTLRLHKPVLSLDHITTARTPKSSAQSSVFARLQARLLPHAVTHSPLATPTIHQDAPEKPPPPKYLKIRIITWNMNESLPKGDLAALLGSVPPYHIDTSSIVDLNIPGLTLESDHPYHLVLVAGQECPTLMGLPLGLGGGIKWDKDKEEEEKKKEKKDKDEGKKKKEKGKDKDLVPTNPEPSPAPTPGSRTPSKPNHPHHTTGWSSILEDYFSHGIGSIPGVKPDFTSPAALNQSLSSLLKSPDRGGSPASATTQAMANKDAKWNLPPGGGEIPKTGPYELLTKERLMGIYLALYVHRDIRSLVEGFSQASVTAGLIGGRLGNKGGIAISLKLQGTTFLFLNAHLAAHEDKVALRISNLTKIKAELSIDDFLPPDDERKVAEDPTDRFDHTFLCGDLNFRLDITRLHAEWLISQKKYAEAQEFDQLRKIMQGLGTHAFTGFSEAPINFPPTFKYDILHTIRGSKRSRKGGVRGRRVLSEVEELEKDDMESSSILRGDTNEVYGAADSESMASSMYQSKRDDDKGSSSSSDGESDGEKDHSFVDIAKVTAKLTKRRWYPFKSAPTLPPSPIVLTSQVEGAPQSSSASKVSVSRATSAAKKMAGSKETVGAVSLNRDTSNQRKSHDAGLLDRSQTIVPPLGARATTSMEIPRQTAVDPSFKPTALIRSISTKSGVGSKTTPKDSINEEAALDVQDMGVYDTSSKQRVPSWCDRILFKTTIDIPPPTPIQEESPDVLSDSQEIAERPQPPHRRMTPMKEFFQHAFRPKSRSSSSTTLSVNSTKAATAEARRLSVAKTSSTGGVSAKRASHPQANGKSLEVATSLAQEAMDSPIAISNSPSPPPSGLFPPDNKYSSNQTTRRTTSPNVPRAGSGGVSSLRVKAKRQRSLSATLPRTSEPVELSGRMMPASASMPPVLPFEYTDGSIVKGEPGSAPVKADPTPASGGGARAIRRVFSFLSGPFGSGQSPMPTVTPGAGQSLVVDGPPPRVYKRGEVQCLEYATLSDREMRCLEGRSDHRPVIGQFAVYL